MRVLKIEDPVIRKQIEDFSDNDSTPNAIRFIQDGAGIWFVTDKVFNNPIYESIKELMSINGEWVDYTAPQEEE